LWPRLNVFAFIYVTLTVAQFSANYVICFAWTPAWAHVGRIFLQHVMLGKVNRCQNRSQLSTCHQVINSFPS